MVGNLVTFYTGNEVERTYNTKQITARAIIDAEKHTINKFSNVTRREYF